ncbi:MAG: alpha/beta hydrolase, partial [Mycolicibacterium sp.]|nr:alpha/beta hydrolase [Mycolicibacterium sp.]
RAFRAVFPLAWRLRYSSPDLQFATKPVGKPRQVTVPTRHGAVRILIYSPPAGDVAAQLAAGHRPPVHLRLHASAFVLRMPEQEDNVARYLASEVGCYVVIPDYDTAPKVRFPVSEQQNFDVFRWMRDHAGDYGWDAGRMTVGGASAGGKFALNVALQAIDAGECVPLAVSAEYGAADLSMPDSLRTSPKRRPMVGPWMLKLARETYVKGADVDDPLLSPARHARLAELPPTLILTAEYDTLRHEMNALAGDLKAKGVRVVHRQFAGVDHFFTHTKPTGVAKAAIGMIGDLLRRAYSDAVSGR